MIKNTEKEKRELFDIVDKVFKNIKENRDTFCPKCKNKIKINNGFKDGEAKEIECLCGYVNYREIPIIKPQKMKVKSFIPKENMTQKEIDKIINDYDYFYIKKKSDNSKYEYEILKVFGEKKAAIYIKCSFLECNNLIDNERIIRECELDKNLYNISFKDEVSYE